MGTTASDPPARRVTAYVGTSGWSYDHWQGVLYPPGSPARERLAHYVRRLRTVEVNRTFYHWPREAVFADWRARLPEGFLLSVKAPRGLTHGGKLADPARWVGRMLPSLELLGDRRGVLLAQLPPDLPYAPERLAAFLDLLPPWPRAAVEFRHPDWQREEAFALLERHGVAYCVTSGAGLPCLLRATAPFVYVRLHGPDPHHLYAGCYSDADLDWWAARIREWQAQGRDVFAYFNNDQHGHAVRNAEGLQARLGIAPP